MKGQQPGRGEAFGERSEKGSSYAEGQGALGGQSAGTVARQSPPRPPSEPGQSAGEIRQSFVLEADF